ncbi:hypothetical protein HKX48_004279 [Thoreauomyces humboldtii]|nr:hypothetical protein HKX48_004279 [Thoreauomyces humboldtii]
MNTSQKYAPVSQPRKLKAKNKAASVPVSANRLEIAHGSEGTPLSMLEDLFPSLPTSELEGVLDAVRHDPQKAVDLLYDRTTCLSVVADALPILTSGAGPGASHAPAWSLRGTPDTALADQTSSLEFLASMFYAIPISVLEEALNHCGGNLESAVDHLLTTPSEFSDDASCMSSSTDHSSMAESAYSLEGGSASSSARTSPGPSSFDPSETVVSQNHDHISTLSAMFPDFCQRTIAASLVTSEDDISAAVDALSRLSLSNPPAVPKFDEQLAALLDMFPDHDMELLEWALEISKGDLERAIEELSGPQRKPEAPCDGKCIAKGYPCLLHARVHKKARPASATTSMGTNKGTVQKTSRASSATSTKTGRNVLTIAGHGSSVGRGSVTSSPEGPEKKLRLSTYAGSAQGHDAQHYRQLAQEYREQRNENFRRAASAFRKGDLTGRGSAAYYSQEGQELTEQMARWNNMAASTVIQRNKARMDDPYTIDLHELTVQEALRYVNEAVNDWWSRDGSSVRPRKHLKIIAGAGQHSSHGIRKLFPAVMRQLKNQGWKLSAGGNGWFYVTGH